METVTRKLILTRGLQGSGKSTFAEKWLAESPDTRSRINRDNIRFSYYGAYYGETVNERGVSEIEYGIAETLMKEGLRDIVVDNTNVTNKAVIPYLLLAAQYGYEVEFIDFIVPVEELIRRDSLRDRVVGESVIRDYAERFYVDGVFRQPPTLVIE